MDFARKRHWFFLLSLLVILPGVVFFLKPPQGLRTGIDFSGGSTMNVVFADTVKQEDLRVEMTDLGHSDATIQQLGDDSFFVRTKELSDPEKIEIVDALESRLSPGGIDVLSSDRVSPVIARETVTNALWAVIAASVLIFIYIWWAFRNVPSPFRYGAAAIVALIHDSVIVIGVFAILGELLEVEVNTFFLFALVTVIGYSVNDTIVVFDKIRENVLLYPNRGLAEVVNLSISETMGRSLNTSLTLLFTLLALLLFGGSTIRAFLLVLLVGVIAGTYSSIGIASQILVAWEYGDFGRLWRRLTFWRAA